jgi:hypothetical protein
MHRRIADRPKSKQRDGVRSVCRRHWTLKRIVSGGDYVKPLSPLIGGEHSGLSPSPKDVVHIATCSI